MRLLPVVAIDPSSKKLATATTFELGQRQPLLRNFRLPVTLAEGCGEAFACISSLLYEVTQESGVHPSVYLEAPIVGRGGAGSTIPQAQISGAIMAAAAEMMCPLYLVNNQTWKKRVCGDGGIDKAEIAVRMRKIWPQAYKAAHGDQDLIDGSAINLFGQADWKLREVLKRRIGSR